MNPGQQLIYIGVEAVFVFVPRRSATPGMGMVAHQLPSSTQRLDSWRLWRTHYAPQERRADGQERAIQGLTRIPTRDGYQHIRGLEKRITLSRRDIVVNDSGHFRNERDPSPTLPQDAQLTLNPRILVAAAT